VSTFCIWSVSVRLTPLLVANATMRPAAGIVGLFTYPIQGAWKSAQSSTGKKQEEQYYRTRVSDGVEAVRNSSNWERQEILRLFKEAKPGTEERKRKLKELAERALRSDGELETESRGPSPEASSTPIPGRPSEQPSTWNDDAESVFQRDLELATQNSLTKPSTSSISIGQDDDDDDERAFQRDLEAARQLSLVDQ